MVPEESAAPLRVLPAPLAGSLAEGALAELDLTPKPGLVDRHDSGSHEDLSYEGMKTSANLLPLYYADILNCCREGKPLESFVRAGIEAEARMNRAIHSNAHKGYIFLSGLALMAAWEGDGRIPALRTDMASKGGHRGHSSNGPVPPFMADTVCGLGPDTAWGSKGGHRDRREQAVPPFMARISEIARRFFAHFEPRDSHGAEIRHNLALGGIRMEAEAGLPAVFEHGWPAYRKALEAGWEPERAGHYLMAILMQRVEDTTAIRRCGLEGLDRLHRDGACIQDLLERRENATPALSALNEEYRQMGLTMGGVADCIALVFALEKASR